MYWRHPRNTLLLTDASQATAIPGHIGCAQGAHSRKLQIHGLMINIEKLEAALEEYERLTSTTGGSSNNGFALHEAISRGIHAEKTPKTLHLWPKVGKKHTSSKFDGVNHIKTSSASTENRKRSSALTTSNNPRKKRKSSTSTSSSGFANSTSKASSSYKHGKDSKVLSKYDIEKLKDYDLSSSYLSHNSSSTLRLSGMSAEDRRKFEFWTEVCGPYFKSTEKTGSLPKNYRQLLYQVEAEKRVSEMEKELNAMKKKIAANTERRRNSKNRHKAAAAANQEARELAEMEAKMKKLQQAAKTARDRPENAGIFAADKAQEPLAPLGTYYRKLWKAEDQAIEDARNPGAARRRQRYEAQQRKREAEEEKRRKRSGGRSSRRNQNVAPKTNEPLKVGDVCEVSESKSGKTSRLQVEGVARIVKIDKEAGTYDIKYVVGNNLLRDVPMKYVRHEGAPPVDSDDEEVTTCDAEDSGYEKDKGAKIRLKMKLVGTDPVPNRPQVKSPDGSNSTHFVLRCWATRWGDEEEEGNDSDNGSADAAASDRKTKKSKAPGKGKGKGSGSARNRKDESMESSMYRKGTAITSDFADSSDSPAATSWHTLPHDGTKGLEIAKDACGSREIALPKVLAGHSLFFGASGKRLQGNRKLRNFNGLEQNKGEDPVTLSLEEFKIVGVPTSDEVDEIYAEMEYLQWKLRVVQNQNEKMALKFQDVIELQLDEEADREKRIASLDKARVEYGTQFNNEQERLRRLMEHRRLANRAALIKLEREKRYQRQKAQREREEKRRTAQNRGHKKKLVMSKISRRGRALEKANLKRIMQSDENGYYESPSQNDSIKTIVNNMVTFISMYNDESFLSKKDLQKRKKAFEDAKKMKEAAKRKEKADAIRRARNEKVAEQRKKFQQDKQFALELLKQLRLIGKKMATVRAARCKHKRENVCETEKVIKICKYFNSKYQGSRSRERKYCFCRTAYDEDQPYVSCDICEDWFHPICVGIPASSTKFIDQFVCPICELISARFPNGNRFETTFKRNVDIELLSCDRVLRMRQAAVQQGLDLITKVEMNRRKERTRRLKKNFMEPINEAIQKRRRKKPKLVVRLKKIGDNKYDFTARNSSQNIIPAKRNLHELDSVATLMPLRVNLKRFMLPKEDGYVGYLPSDWDNKNCRPFYIRKALNKLHSFECIFGNITIVEKDYSFVNFHDVDDSDDEGDEDTDLVEETEKDDLELEIESKKVFEAARMKLATSLPVKKTPKMDSKSKQKSIGNASDQKLSEDNAATSSDKSENASSSSTVSSIPTHIARKRPKVEIVCGCIENWTLANGTHPKIYLSRNSNMIKNPILRSKKDEMDAEKYERDYLEALAKESQGVEADGSGDLDKPKIAAGSDDDEVGIFLDDIDDVPDEEMEVDADVEAAEDAEENVVVLIESNDSYE